MEDGHLVTQVRLQRQGPLPALQRDLPGPREISRESPCQDCSKILEHFPLCREALWEVMDKGIKDPKYGRQSVSFVW
jgi:hypothetical protein